MRRQFMLSTHPDTTALGTFTAFGCPGFDQFSFEFRKAAQHRQHKPTSSGRGISPMLGQLDEQRFVVGDGFEDHQQINGRPSQPFQSRDYYDVTGLQRRYQLGQRLPVRLCPAGGLPFDASFASWNNLQAHQAGTSRAC
jgi:hypothetical protein